MTSQAGLQAAKVVLRKKMKEKLGSLTAESKAQQSRRVTEKLLAMSQYRTARSVALYLRWVLKPCISSNIALSTSMDDEIDTESIVADVLTGGKQCFIPRYEMGSSRMEMVRLRDLEDLASLPRTKWNIRQPELTEEREEALEAGLDLIIVPGLAFSRAGARCGRGRGYYDAYLARAATSLSSSPPLTIALAFNEQLLEEVPTDSHDHTIDLVITPSFHQTNSTAR